jgi:hypothetical protein
LWSKREEVARSAEPLSARIEVAQGSPIADRADLYDPMNRTLEKPGKGFLGRMAKKMIVPKKTNAEKPTTKPSSAPPAVEPARKERASPPAENVVDPIPSQSKSETAAETMPSSAEPEQTAETTPSPSNSERAATITPSHSKSENAQNGALAIVADSDMPARAAIRAMEESTVTQDLKDGARGQLDVHDSALEKSGSGTCARQGGVPLSLDPIENKTGSSNLHVQRDSRCEEKLDAVQTGSSQIAPRISDDPILILSQTTPIPNFEASLTDAKEMDTREPDKSSEMVCAANHLILAEPVGLQVALCTSPASRRIYASSSFSRLHGLS